MSKSQIEHEQKDAWSELLTVSNEFEMEHKDGSESLSNEIADHASSGLPSARSTAISLLMLQGSLEPSEPQAFLVRKTITVGSQSQSAKQKRKCAPSARVLGRVPDWNPPQHQAKKKSHRKRGPRKSAPICSWLGCQSQVTKLGGPVCPLHRQFVQNQAAKAYIFDMYSPAGAAE